MPVVSSLTMLPVQGSMIGPIELDCAISETHTWASIVTRVPVESGAERAQHIVDQPYTLRIEAVVSDMPWDATLQSVAAAANFAVSGALAAKAIVQNQPDAPAQDQDFFNFSGGVSQAVDAVGQFRKFASQLKTAFAVPQFTAYEKSRVALARILKLRDSHEPFDYISPLGVMQRMVFQLLEVPVDTTQDFLFRATLIRFEEVGLTKSDSLAKDQVDASSDPENVGSRTTVDTNIPTLFAA